MSAPTAAQAELISSLSQDEIPIKLRCAICSKLAVNAFRLPCCDQAICETCHSTLPSSCPVCEHTPVASEDCKPHKSLRTTIKVFLRTEEKKRVDALAKQSKETPPATPVEALPTPTELSSLTGPVDDTSKKTLEDATSANGVQTDAGAGKPAEENNISAETGASEISQSEEHDVPQPSIEEIAPGQEPSEDVKQADASVDGEKVEKKDTAEKEGETGVAPTPAFGSGFGFDQSASGGFPGMGFSGDFNQMQMMMAMQNGMAPGGFGNFPMMGMPGMNMDPMTMQNMMMNGGFGGAGMGMNGMNMGMGMGNFDGGIGAGFNNGWNSQQSWNVGPDNFNHPNAAGMGPGDYGANNSGFPQNAAGFNQGNFGRANQYNDYQNSYSQGYQGRGRGRGRGGWHQNRGGHGHGFNDHSQHLQQQVGQGQQSSESYNENDPMSTGPKGETESGSGANVDEFGRELRQDTPKNEAENGIDGINIQDAVSSATKDGKEQQVNSEDVSQHDTSGTGNDDFTPQPIQSLEANESAAFAPMPMIGDGFNAMSLVDPNMRYLSHPRGGFLQSRGGRGGSFHAMQPPFVKPVDVPINAPTGPKAMREGPKPALPNIRTHGFSIAGKASASARGSVSGISVAPESATQERGRTRSPSLEKERDRSQSRSKSKDHKRDRSRERRHRRRHRSASRSRSEDEEESERRREKRRERRRRHEEEADLERDSNESKAEKKDDDRRRDDENRSRSASPQESKRSSHRSSRRDRDKYRDRERDDDKHRSSSHKHRSSHRSHRDERSRSRERERSERDREREHRHRQSRHASRDAEDRVKGDTPVDTPTEPNLSSRKSSLISSGLNGIEIKGASSRNKSSRDINLPLNIPTGPKGGERDREREREKDRSSRHSESHRSRRESERNNTSSRDQEKDRPEKKKEEVDPHTLEREARNRERLLKEAQRIAGLTSALSVGRKRSRDEVDDGSGRKGRKKGRRAGGEDNDEARIARLEAERESSRWA
ncbi:hypothetical protein sscle_14g098940 [Sclerotinia sclerotiorum 1980 UF-70]|uniref:RING-type domain-containing protein n=1 Tax=Sclerotinia sclerotiorum (strain ATCC 18683 / 1980 / Ss-1) TaxID=665079 RepID=A0A1D9QJM0_SCLS1|nr:hypothetical protein sscle_14g098940 [Sclerotinia sclerotiorum 1980 UF-70]